MNMCFKPLAQCLEIMGNPRSGCVVLAHVHSGIPTLSKNRQTCIHPLTVSVAQVLHVATSDVQELWRP